MKEASRTGVEGVPGGAVRYQQYLVSMYGKKCSDLRVRKPCPFNFPPVFITNSFALQAADLDAHGEMAQMSDIGIDVDRSIPSSKNLANVSNDK